MSKSPILRCLGGLLISLFIVPSYATEITVIESNAQSVILELILSTPVISEQQLSGKRYQALSIAGTGSMSDVGDPELPFRGVFIAIPDNSHIQLEILDSEFETQLGYLLPPVPTLNLDNIEQALYIENAHSYQDDRLLPAITAKIGMTGKIRDQNVAQIQFFPVRHNPVTRTIEVYKRLRVKINFINNTRASQQVQEQSAAFDQMLHHLLINDSTSQRILQRTASARLDCPTPPIAIKLRIDKTGVYTLTYAEVLQVVEDTLGPLNIPGLSAHELDLTHQGNSIALFIAGGEDGLFGPNDVLYFYAESIETHYTRHNIYWLSLNINGGTRVQFREATPITLVPQLTASKQTVHVEKNLMYWERMNESIGKDHLFWETIAATESKDITIELPFVAETTGNATVRIMLQGRTDTIFIAPDHHTKILLNDIEISDAEWNGQAVFLQEVTIPQSQLLEGTNTLTILSVGDTGATVDTVMLNWAEIDYLATTQTTQNQLHFKTESIAQYQMTVSGFTQSDLLVLDVTHPQQVVALTGVVITDNNTEAYQLEYTETGAKAFYAFSLTDNLLSPAEISLDMPAKVLQTACHQVDYFIIHHDSFDVTEFQNVIAARGLNVMDVPVSDIYDEFSHGLIDLQAIKDFLSYAYNNYGGTRAYVVLVGDANQDTLNELGHGINYLPTPTFHTYIAGETSRDNWFVSISGDDQLPDMFLGRIPVQTQVELDAVVHKVATYPASPQGDWQRTALFISDNITEFDTTSDLLIEDYFTDYTVQQIYLTQYTGDRDTIQAAAKQDIIQYINDGAILVNYTGHGSVSNWAGEFIFESNDVASLENPDTLSFVLALNCFNGQFSYYQPFYDNEDSLAEAFLKTDGKGAIAMWASTALGYSYQHEIMANELFQGLLIEQQTEIGPLTTGVKIDLGNYIGINNIETFTLFGDPNTHLLFE